MIAGKITDLKHKLIEYATLVENMIDKSIKGLIQKEEGVLKDVIENDELRANDFEIELDELCAAVIAQFQPAAKNLRTILMILKMNNDLERIGDHAVNICDSALFLITRPQIKVFKELPAMVEETKHMLKNSINSFINEDAELANSICEKDKVVDKLRDNILAELISIMLKEPEAIERALFIMRIARNLERIADLSTNICEDIIYMVEGLSIKHHKTELNYKESVHE